jgi:hypothetical protein
MRKLPSYIIPLLFVIIVVIALTMLFSLGSRAIDKSNLKSEYETYCRNAETEIPTCLQWADDAVNIWLSDAQECKEQYPDDNMRMGGCLIERQLLSSIEGDD